MRTGVGGVAGLRTPGLMVIFVVAASWLSAGVASAQFVYDASCKTPGGRQTVQGRSECVMAAAYSAGDDLQTVSVVQRLLIGGAEPNYAEQKGDTAVHYAASSKYPRMLQVILNAGGDPNRRGSFGHPPLFRSIRDGSIQPEAARVDTVRVLLHGGADPNAVEDQHDGNTALHVVSDDLFELRGAEIASDLLGAGANPNRRNRDGQMPLHLAAAQGHSEIVAALLRGGADPNATNGSGQTPLQVVLGERMTRDTGVVIVRALLRAGADPNRRGPNGDRPLHTAVGTASTETREFAGGAAWPRERIRASRTRVGRFRTIGRRRTTSDACWRTRTAFAS